MKMTQSSEISKENNSTEPGKQRRDKNFQSKVVIRRLPPTMTEEQFLDQISPLPENDYIYFVKADLSLGVHAFSRAYISFLNQDDILLFKDKFDGYVFVDAKGMEYPGLVEFAPFQKIPKKRSKKKDTKCGTIEQDPDYIKFVELLKNPAEESPTEATVPDLTEDTKSNNRTTPLIEFLKQRKLEKQKLRDEKREERKKRDLERKRLREEERRKRKTEKGPEGTSETNNNNSGSDTNTPKTTEQLPVELLKKPEREISEPLHKPPPLNKSYKERESHAKEYTKPFREKGARRGDWERDRQREKVAAQRERDRARKEESKASSSSKSGSSPLDQVKGFAAGSSKESGSKGTGSSVGRASVGSVFTEDPAVVAAALEAKDTKPLHAKELRKERQRIRNKDRPSLEIYRPGMRRLSSGAPSGSSRSSPQKENSQSPCTSPTPQIISNNNNEDDERPETEL